VELGGGCSNYDGFRQMGWRAHVYGELQPELADWCRDNGIALDMFDWEERYDEAGFARGAVYLVRPDSYVAFADPQPSRERLQAYFSRCDVTLPLRS
jgi:hypothetical protein